MKNRVVGFTLAGLLAVVGFGLVLSSLGGDDGTDRVDAAAGSGEAAAGSPAQLAAAKDDDDDEDAPALVGIPVPPELARVTLQLEPQRALGGLVAPGELVAVTASFDRAQAAADAGPQSGVILEKILVTAVQVEEPAGDAEDPTPPRGTLLVTLAVPPPEAAKLIFASEYGRVWLSGEVPATPETGRAPVNYATINPVPAP